MYSRSLDLWFPTRMLVCYVTCKLQPNVVQSVSESLPQDALAGIVICTCAHWGDQVTKCKFFPHVLPKPHLKFKGKQTEAW